MCVNMRLFSFMARLGFGDAMYYHFHKTCFMCLCVLVHRCVCLKVVPTGTASSPTLFPQRCIFYSCIPVFFPCAAISLPV